ncbi:hypothetical protein BGW80DRAFT_1348595, partial [Lactifluus volemus]
MPPCPPRGPKLFFTSAKTGAGVSGAEPPTGVRKGSTVGLDQAMIGQKRISGSTCCFY